MWAYIDVQRKSFSPCNDHKVSRSDDLRRLEVFMTAVPLNVLSSQRAALSSPHCIQRMLQGAIQVHQRQQTSQWKGHTPRHLDVHTFSFSSIYSVSPSDVEDYLPVPPSPLFLSMHTSPLSCIRLKMHFSTAVDVPQSSANLFSCSYVSLRKQLGVWVDSIAHVSTLGDGWN